MGKHGGNSFGNGRFLALVLCAATGLLWACCELMLMEKPCEPEMQSREQQLAYSMALQREQALQQHVAELEQRLSTARLQSTATNGDGSVLGLRSLVATLEAEGKRLRGKNAELEQTVRQFQAGSVALPGGAVALQGGPVALQKSPQELQTGVGIATVDGLLPTRLPMRPPLTEEELKVAASNDAIAVVVISCKRPKYLQRAMDSILKAPRDKERFPIIISQDAYDPTMTQMIETTYSNTGIAFHMHHEHDPAAPEIGKRFAKNSKTVLGYVRIAQHYGFVMRRTFDDMGFQQVIFLEEDMEIAPDFFLYFESMLTLLRGDSELFCVSAWNDNGYSSLVLDPKAVYRTEFFPGLGWMLQKRFWDEIRDRFAVAYWDEFMRRPDVRKGRQCIRPDISRSFTFGSEGTSQGQFFKDHLRHIRLSDVPVDWRQEDLHFLSSKPAFEEWLTEQLRKAVFVPMPQVDTVVREAKRDQAFRIAYDDKREYAKIAKKFGLMPDEKEGIRRMSYRGVIPFAWNGRRIYLYTRTWPVGLDM